MDDFLKTLVLAFLPAMGNFAGGVLAEILPTSNRALSLALHTAAGIVIAVVAVELMPTVLETDTPWVIVLAFVLGGIFYIAVDLLVAFISKNRESPAASSGPLLIYFSVAVDLFSDGILIGTATNISLGLGLILALGQVTADVPEGFATIVSFKEAGTNRTKRLIYSASFAVPILLAASLAFWGVRGQSELLKFALLSFTAGTLTTATVEEIVPQAHEKEEARLATVLFISGFALFTLLSLYLD